MYQGEGEGEGEGEGGSEEKIYSSATRWISKQRQTPPSVQNGNHCHLANEIQLERRPS